MAVKFASVLALSVLPDASAAVVSRGQSFLGNGMQPEVVARTLSNVEDEWKAQAAVFAECDTTSGLPGASIVNCADAPASFGKSCSTVVGAIIQGSGGDKDVAKEYMDDVCKDTLGWHQTQCQSLAVSVRGAMSADKYTNRMSFNSDKLCSTFWAQMLDGEKTRLAQEKADREVTEKKAAEEAAEQEKQMEESRKKEGEQKKVEEAERAKEEAKAKAEESAAHLKEKKAEAEAVTQAAKKKMLEAEAAAAESKAAAEKQAAATKIAEEKVVAKPVVPVAAAPVAKADVKPEGDLARMPAPAVMAPKEAAQPAAAPKALEPVAAKVAPAAVEKVAAPAEVKPAEVAKAPVAVAAVAEKAK